MSDDTKPPLQDERIAEALAARKQKRLEMKIAEQKRKNKIQSRARMRKMRARRNAEQEKKVAELATLPKSKLHDQLATLEGRVGAYTTAVKRSKFATLDDEICKELDLKLMQGVPFIQIATWLQQEKGVFTEQRLDSLAMAVSRYKDKVFILKYSVADTFLDKDSSRIVLEAIRGSMDLATEFHELVELQKRRLAGISRVEKMQRGLDSNVSREIEVLHKLLKTFADFQMDIGTLKRVPTKTLIAGNFDDASLDQARKADKATQEAVLNVINDTLQYLKTDTIEGEVVPDGEDSE